MDKKYSVKNTIIAVLGSHVALEVCRGAKDEGFKTLVVCEKGREKTYNHYYKARESLGCVDECIVLDNFVDIILPHVQKQLQKKHVIFIPNRSLEAYLAFNYLAIEEEFRVPLFGNKFLLKIEERNHHPNQYDLLERADIRIPKQFIDSKKIDRLCLVKVNEKERIFERAFFLVENYGDFTKQAKEKIRQGIITKEALEIAVIEEFVLGVQVNFNFFYSPLLDRLELLGTDTRRQTNIEGITKTPAIYQNEMQDKISMKYEEAGHIAVTVLESLLEQAFIMGEKFVKTSQSQFAPGIIGPFALQTIIVPGPPKKDIVVIDVSPRMPGSPGISATPYSGYLHGSSVSVGRRVAQEIKLAMSTKSLDKVLS